MNIIDIIDKKRLSFELSLNEIEYVIDNYLNDVIKDYQMSALLMAIVINGMSDDEVINLTNTMLNSGDVIDLSNIVGTVVDKHSTGGVGDKTTLILAPLVAACGIPVAKMSGRGLGHTGGTIDKLESIDNFQVELDNDDFINQVNKIGVALVGQKGNLVPADKKIYSLRDVTGTTSSIALIASSIMSKKLASGADKIVIDVKVGAGALINNLDDAHELARLMVKIGTSNNKETICVITNMESPLGRSIGNGLEVIESIEFLKGNSASDLYELTTYLAATMVSLGKKIEFNEAMNEVVDKIESGEALNKFLELVSMQKGNIDNIECSTKAHTIMSSESGYINKIDALKLGNLVKELGGGRNSKDDEIDLSVGFVLFKQVGDYINVNEELLKVYYNNKDIKIQDILDCFTIELINNDDYQLIYDVVK